MNKSKSLTPAIIDELGKSVQQRGLRLEKRDTPISPGYLEEWVIRDGGDWNYAGFGIRLNGGYEYTLASSKSLPFDVQTTMNWIESEIVRIVKSLTSQ